MGDLRLSKNGKNNWEIQIPIVELLTLGAGVGTVGKGFSNNSPSKVLEDELEKSKKKKKNKKKKDEIPNVTKAGFGLLGAFAGAVGTVALNIWSNDQKKLDEEFKDDGKNKSY